MNFKNWLESIKDTAQTFKGLLHNVPQDPIHHPEGDALVHTRLVRKAIPRAVQELQTLKSTLPFSDIFQNIDFDISEDEYQVLYLAAWLHDIGKSSATTIDTNGKIRSIGHQDTEHYMPQINKFKGIIPKQTYELYISNKNLIDFLIQRHMDFMNDHGFPMSIIKTHFENGKVKKSQEMKLLLVLMWADKMGRRPEDDIYKSLTKNATRLHNSSIRSAEYKPPVKKDSYQGSPDDFVKMLKSRNMPTKQVVSFLKNKYPQLDQQQIQDLMS